MGNTHSRDETKRVDRHDSPMNSAVVNAGNIDVQHLWTSTVTLVLLIVVVIIVAGKVIFDRCVGQIAKRISPRLNAIEL